MHPSTTPLVLTLVVLGACGGRVASTGEGTSSGAPAAGGGGPNGGGDQTSTGGTPSGSGNGAASNGSTPPASNGGDCSAAPVNPAACPQAVTPAVVGAPCPAEGLTCWYPTGITGVPGGFGPSCEFYGSIVCTGKEPGSTTWHARR
jgi:hypothetical protein